MTEAFKISKRLLCAASLSRPGAFVADVGTDHAYLPIYLALSGKIRGGVVSDVREGPLQRAIHHINEQGLSSLLTPLLCDGAAELKAFDPEDIFILGMGGELIARILGDAPWLADPKHRLILQPMTHPEALRRFLWDHGFAIVRECLVLDEKLYTLLCAEYVGENTPYDSADLLFGKKESVEDPVLYDRLLSHWETVLSHRRAGKTSASADTREEDELLIAIGERKHDCL